MDQIWPGEKIPPLPPPPPPPIYLTGPTLPNMRLLMQGVRCWPCVTCANSQQIMHADMHSPPPAASSAWAEAILLPGICSTAAACSVPVRYVSEFKNIIFLAIIIYALNISTRHLQDGHSYWQSGPPPAPRIFGVPIQ